MIAERLEQARAAALSDDDAVSERAEREAVLLQYLQRLAEHPRAEQALSLALEIVDRLTTGE